MSGIIGKLRRSESGASLVEFAILAPVMVFLMIGLIDVGRFTYYSVLAANAARAGAQYGAQSLTFVDATPQIQSAASSDGQGLSWTTTPQCLVSTAGGTPVNCPAGASSAPPGTVYYVQVTTTGQFNTLIAYPGIRNPVRVTGSSTMRVASQ